jgi:hypothetical protein
VKNRIIRENSTRRIPIIGKIKVGEKIERNGKPQPVSYDYFVADGNYKHIFDRQFHQKNSLDIVFISDDPSECCVELMEIRKGKKLYAKGDGVNFEVWDSASQKYTLRNTENEPNLIQEIEKECNNEFQEVLNLYFLILGISEVFGVWKFSTKGKESSIPAIVSSFDMVLQVAGRIKFIPFTLSVEKVKSQKPDSKNLFPVVSLIANIGQEYMETLRDHIGIDSLISGMLTEDRIDSAVQQIEYQKPDILEKIDSDVDRMIVKMACCNSLQELKGVGYDIHKLNLSKEQVDVLKNKYREKQKELEGGCGP